MSLSTIRTAIKSKLELVTDVENVKDFVIWSDKWDDLLAYFVKDGRVNTWQIGLRSTPEVYIDNGIRETAFMFNIYGLYSMKTENESSKVFEGITEAVLYEFSKANSFLTNTELTQKPSLVSFENAIYLQNPVHRCLINLQVTERVGQDLS